MTRAGKHSARVHLTKVHPAEAADAGKTDASSKYAASLEDLEASAHVPLDEQVTEQPESPAASPISDGEVERQAMLRVTGPL